MAAATTPPPRGTRLHTPPAPLHGAQHDSYEPYSPRRSTRISNRQAHLNTPGSAKPDSQLSKRKPTYRRTSSQTFSPPSSPVSPEQRHSRAGKRSEFLSEPAHQDLLPTPVKTPRKRAVNTELGSASRALFHNHNNDPHELMPTPRRTAKARQAAIALGSFAQDSEPDSFQIFTDSKERMPEPDHSEDNPFVTKKVQRGTTNRAESKRPTRRSSRSKYGMGKSVDAAVENDEGMVYVFRGRKVFRKFADQDNNGDTDEEAAQVMRSAGVKGGERMTQRSIKPRLLFPPADITADAGTTDEEAVTDIEGPTQDVPYSKKARFSTPVKHRFQAGPATPPTTVKKSGRTFKQRLDEVSAYAAVPESHDDIALTDSEHVEAPIGRDERQGTKSASRRSSGVPMKRSAEPVDPLQETSAKRTRSLQH